MEQDYIRYQVAHNIKLLYKQYNKNKEAKYHLIVIITSCLMYVVH